MIKRPDLNNNSVRRLSVATLLFERRCGAKAPLLKRWLAVMAIVALVGAAAPARAQVPSQPALSSGLAQSSAAPGNLSAPTTPTVPASTLADTSYYALTAGGRRDTMSIRVSDGDLPVLIFQVNKYRVSDERRLSSIAQLVDSLRLAQALDHVWIAGSASPEGNVAWNWKLGEYRAAVLADYLRAHTSLPEAQLKVDNLGEDWETLTAMLLAIENRTPQYDRVLQIIASEPDWARRKELIKAIDGGATWSKLLRELFPPLRNARMALICFEGTFIPKGVGVRLSPIAGLAAIDAPDALSPTMPLLPLTPVAAVPTEEPRTRYLALGTNLIFASARVAILEAEVELWPKWTFDLPVCFSPYDITTTWRLRLLTAQPEVRRWTREAGRGHYFGLHATIAGFNVSPDSPGRYQDPDRAAWGFGLGYGYALDLGRRRRWNVCFSVGAGFVDYRYREFVNEPNGPLRKEGSGTYWGLTRLGVTVAYTWHLRRR